MRRAVLALTGPAYPIAARNASIAIKLSHQEK
jgi:hypothetical protein